MLKNIMKKLEQGITDFKEFIDEDCYFVDKTHLIAYLIDHPSKVHLITRPRRFGKTLNLSMIRHFLEAPLPPHTGNPLFALRTSLPPPPETLRSNTLPPGQSRTQNAELRTHHAYLFEDLTIASHPRCAEFMGQYPVIHLSFKNVKSPSHENSMRLIQSCLADEFRRHNYLKDRDCLADEELTLFNRILSRKGSEQDCAESLRQLSAWLHRAYGTPHTSYWTSTTRPCIRPIWTTTTIR